MFASGRIKRFYQEAGAGAAEDGFTVILDGRAIKTPGRATLLLPTRALAEAIAGEWSLQVDTVKPETMVLMNLACTAIDIVAPRREAVVAELAGFGETDLVCYRVEQPPALVERQSEQWQPLLDWAAAALNAPLVTTSGLLAAAQPAEALAALGRAVADHDDMALAALASAVKAAGSLVIGLALSAGRIGVEAAFTAAELHESQQIEAWGEDPEATKRRAQVLRDLETAARFLALLRE